ncbi:SGNH/GDSL hydrolase family protein [Neorhizobium lilium]|uniref:SGNH/GDSL hydrolase family protein n=1 Tax=Neorhizobium lilium TaxID=2503024 RepID=A0A444LIC1_9HYPH|nr:SGNH/GDSL hydrolase family protein [Neorhizobium lilium]RWX78771.1 SGNH/GDSL hydrolase family protein [Neorhizobium lilium]
MLMVGAESGPMRGSGNTTYLPAFVCPVPAGAITPNATLRFGGHINKFGTANGGHNLKVTVAQGANEVVITQAFINASLLFFNWRAELTFSADRKFGFMDSVNVFNGATGSVAAGSFTNYIAKNAGSANLGARARSASVAFATYSTPPTQETRLIDFDQTSEIRFYLGAVAADTVAMNSGYAELLSPGTDPSFYVPSNATLFFGHSLVEGTGATAGNDVVSQLRGLKPGRSISNLGLGGQTYAAGSASFADRVLADPRAKSLDMIIWGPENDATGDGPTWANTVLTRLAQIMGNRKSGAKTIICNSVTSTAWNAGVVAAAQYVNAQLAASQWGSLIADMYTPICTAAGGYPNPAYLATSDTIHHNDTGYGVDANTISAKMTALGWT